MALTAAQKARLRKLRALKQSGAELNNSQAARLKKLQSLKQAGTEIKNATSQATDVLSAGTSLGTSMLPEVFEGGTGLGRLNFDDYNQYLTPSVDNATATRDATVSAYDELAALREAKLGGLDAAENQALKESLFRDIDKQKATAMRDVARNAAQSGSGASFAQKRALNRDYGDAAIQANKDLILENIGIKNEALDAYESTTAAGLTARASAEDTLAGLTSKQAALKSSVDQYNQNQLADELAARVAAISAGTGLVTDQTGSIQETDRMNTLLEFLKERDSSNYEDILSIING